MFFGGLVPGPIFGRFWGILWSTFGGHLGALLGSLGSLWTPLGIPWPLLGTPWPPFGTSGDPIWHLWELFGHSLGPLEGAWRPEEDKKYMRIKREAAGQEEKEREQNLTENSNNRTLEG